MVIINRHNYEEYFLLYVDDELSEAQRIAVQNFVQQNPDTAREFGLLKKTKLSADEDIEFAFKDNLYKSEPGISLINYEEFFVLSIDNELEDEEQADLERFILQHPELQEEFILLQSTVLPAEVAEYTDKPGLYRTEKKRRIPVLLMRMGIAASIIGLVAILWTLNQNNTMLPGKTNPIVYHPKTRASSQPGVNINVMDSATQLDPALRSNNKGERIAKNISPRKQRAINTGNIKKQNAAIKTNELNAWRNNELVNANPLTSPDIVRIREEISGKNILEKSSEGLADKPLVNLTADTKNNAANAEAIIKQAVYQEIENDEESNTIYIGAAEINKAKLKGLLRKAVNFFDRKTKNNDSEKTIQIASFQIKS